MCLYETIAQKMQAEPAQHFLLAILTPDNLAGILASYGSLRSDAIMRGIAQRLSEIFPEPDVCYSMTGTDLVLLLSLDCDEQEMREALSCAQKAIAQPVHVDGMDYYITASCGTACFPTDGTDRDELIMKANLALYQARQTGESIVFFSEQISQKLHNRLLIRNALPKALANREFELFFQPQIDMVSDHMTGFEALLRWHSEVLGEVSPRDFIPVAEESRLIVPIGAWVLEQACIALKRVNEKFCTNYCVAVNVSGVQLFADDFVDQVLAVLERTGVEPCLLELEVTESVLISRNSTQSRRSTS